MYKFYKITILLVFTCLSFQVIAQDTTIIVQYNIPIQSGQDDVEEEISSGFNYVNSTDLEMTYVPDDDIDQIVGLHFSGIPLTSGEVVSEAYIQFVTDEISAGNSNLQIYGEASTNASPFTGNNFDVSSRPLVATSVDWFPAFWTVLNSAAEDQRTTNIAPIINSIISQPAWQEGNNINIIIQGSGHRIAHAYEGNPDFAPKLILEASTTVSNGDISDIYINELMANNSVYADEYGETDDWLELYNENDEAILLEGLYISDDASDLTKFQIEEPLIIPSQGFALFWLDDAPEQGENHLPFKLSSGGENVFLSQQQGNELVIIDEIIYENLPENVSFGRETDGANNWVLFGEYTPNESNNGSGLYLNANLDFSLSGGHYGANTPLSITCSDPSAEIRYTTDGSEPSVNSLIFTQPILLTETTVVQAAAYKSGYAGGPKNSEFYIIDASHELPIVQVTIDPHLLWDNQDGFYIRGENGIGGYCSDEPVNWNQDWEHPAKVRYFETNGEEAFQVNVGMKIAGGCSRNFAMKGFNFFLRGDGISDNKVEYPLFQDLDFEEYKRFKLRNSGNDYELTFIRDAAIHSMLRDEVDIDLMAYEPVVVYLNNEYWGVQGMREFYNRHYLAAHHDVDKDSVDMLKGNPYSDPVVKAGDTEAWDELFDFVSNNSFGNNATMAQVAEVVDLNEYINYNIAQIYVANYDWPANNVGVWRDRNDGKWRWMLYDVDISSGFDVWFSNQETYNMINHATTTTGDWWPNGEPSTRFLRKMLQNTDFRNEFTQRTCTFGQVIFDADRTEYFIDSLSTRIASEIPGLTNKFNNPSYEWANWTTNPAGGSVSNWQNNLNTYKNFFANRFFYLRQNYQNHFNYSGSYFLIINYDENTNGTVVFHQNEMKIPFNYSGQYFKNIPMQIKAIPKPGYRFVHWEETGNTNATIQYVGTQNAQLTPIFELETTPISEIENLQTKFEIFPNPTNTILNIKYNEMTETDFELNIYNALGQIIYTENLTAELSEKQHTIDVNDWKNGIYFLKTNLNEKEVFVKFVVGE